MTAPQRPFRVSMVENTHPGGLLSKTYHYSEQNGLTCETEASVFEGRVTTHEFSRISCFMDFRGTLKTNQALIMGKPMYDDAQLVTQEALAPISPDRQRAEHIIARDRAHVSWPDGPALVMLDLDRPDRFPTEIQARVPTMAADWHKLLIEFFSAFNNVQMAWAPSSSSCLYLADRELHGLRGQRFYFVIDSGQKIPAFRDALHALLVHRGLVWFEVSKSGLLLERTPFDLSTFQPERLDFAAGPTCTPPLEWRPAEPIVWHHDGAYFDAGSLPSLTDADRRCIAETLRLARGAKEDEARVRREQWKTETGRNIALRQSVTQEQAADVVAAAVDRGILLPEFLLTDSTEQLVSVGELLKAAATHHGRRFHDPLEPDYHNDPRIAVFLVDERGRARIYSHAHGGQRWRCEQRVPQIVHGPIDSTIAQLVAALSFDDCGIYRHGQTLVGLDERNGRMQVLDVEGLGLRLQQHFRVLRGSRQGQPTPGDLNVRVLKALQSIATRLPIRSLSAIVRGPFARADGTVVDTPGYDPASEVMYLADSSHPPQARRHVNLVEAEAALRRLWYPVSQFPYTTNTDRGVVLETLLMGVVRPSILTAPGILVTAHTPGTGKTLLAQTLGAFQTGQVVPVSPMLGEEEERRKHLFAAARQGASFVLYDNAERGTELDSAVLAHLITSPLIEGRVLGVSTNEYWPNRMTIAVTGNNITLRGDLNRRLLPITLDAEVEHPWEREFLFHPVDYVRAHWLELRIAALELIQAWRDDGAPRARGASGFPEWDLIRSVVVWVTEWESATVRFADPLEAIRVAYTHDPETEVLGALLQAWHACYGDRAVVLKELDPILDEFGPSCGPSPDQERDEDAARLREAWEAVRASLGPGSTDSRVRLGMYINRHKGQIVGGLRFEKLGLRGGVRKWRVVRVKEPPLTPLPTDAVAGGANGSLV